MAPQLPSSAAACLEQRDGAVAVAQLRECAAGEGPSKAGLDRRVDLVGERCRGQGPLNGRLRVTVVQGDGGRCAMRHGGGETQADRGRAGLRLLGGAASLGAVTERQPIAGHQLEEVRAPGRRKRSKLITVRAGQHGRGAARLPVVEQRDARGPLRRGRR